MVKRSPITSGLARVHHIPFGVDARSFLPDDRKAESRRRLRIPIDDEVIFLRASAWDLKGLSFLIEALASKPPSRPTTLLTVDKRGLLEALRPDYNVIDLGWVNDDDVYPLAFSACDMFVMPSIAETFGLMAVEAMAAGRPVICFEGTALPAVTHAPDCGIAVPLRDAGALRAAIDRLSADPSEAAERGRRGREIAAEEYGHDRYLDAMTGLYESIFARDSP